MAAATRPPMSSAPLSRVEYAGARGAVLELARAVADLPAELPHRLVSSAERALGLGLHYDAGGRELELELRAFRAFAHFRDELGAIRDEANR